ncbi:hypothetical protein [Paenibacillus sp. FSL H7-0331]|uniref:hypothetical protein n=1 Tax=Paenibacillus sp. FSL H7-0331 TaxID=1920421 RepID=UPI00096F7ECB|nr:hypothetical protein [Paenibacillus sp. FSL H7-0331]OMF18820.1 hypothetical protein BK127_08850 [Paenibacillus sp. FSL H7-0331]
MKRFQCVIILSLLFLLAACGLKEEPWGEKNLVLQASELKRLVIDNKNGEIEIVGTTDSDSIQVTADVTSKNINKDNLKLDLNDEKDTAYLNASFKSQFLSMGSGTVNLQIKAPKHLQIEILSHKDGNIRILDMSSGVKVDNINGNINVANTKGPLTITSRDGNLKLYEITSDIEIKNVNGQIDVDQVEGSAIIDVGDGTLDLNHVGQNATITQSGNGQIKIGDVKGTVVQKKK